jgi:uncharacterized protein YdhG (YjbR/CyaY superfamily)
MVYTPDWATIGQDGGMKKLQSGKRRPAKNGAGRQSVDDYISALSQPARGKLQQMRAAIRSVVPAQAVEVISYRIPAFRHQGVVVWYAAFRKHCSLFPTAGVIEQFKDDLAGYTVSKGTIQFRLDRPLPVRLIKKMVKARVAGMGHKKGC